MLYCYTTKFLFQFHKGAIRTCSFITFSTIIYKNFNSIKVRLEPLAVLRSMLAITNFNSIKVRLELRYKGIHYNADTYFNSIKVRLEPSKKVISLATSVFQFHKGAIRTVLGGLRPDKQTRFQFHKGAIRTSQG